MGLVLVVTLIWMETQGSSTTLIRLVLVVLVVPRVFHHHATWPGILVVGVSTTFAKGASVRISTILKCYKNCQSELLSHFINILLLD
jgi:ABC-type iron transport system FetAB permease component